MSNFDFSDEETKIENDHDSNLTHTPSSPSLRSLSNKKKRFRLNYGSSKLTCRKEIDHDDDVVNECDHAKETIESSSGFPKDTSRESSSTLKAPEKPVPRRRRKRNLATQKERKIKDDFFSKTSPEKIQSSPSSFLSSVKTIFSISSGSILASNDTKHSNIDGSDEEEQIAIEGHQTCDDLVSPSNSSPYKKSPNKLSKMEKASVANFSPSPQSSHAPSSIISYQSESVVATRAGTDSFAAQDAGTFRMVLDDFMYYCSSFFSSVDDNGRIIQGNIASDAVCDLAIMLSSKKTRSILMTFGGNNDTQDAIGSDSEVSALKSILQVISLSPHPDRDLLPSKTEFKLISRDTDCLSKEYSPIVFSTINRQENHAPAHNSTEFMNKTRSKSARRQKLGISISSQTQHNQIISRALALIVHFLSMDCLSMKDKSIFGSNPTAAKQFRKRLLQDQSSLQGISRLLLNDVVVSSILELNTQDDNAKVPEQGSQIINSTNIVVTSSKDPTKLGRRKRKQKKSSSDDVLLSTNENNALDRQNDIENAKANNGFDFTSDGTNSIASTVKSLDNINRIPSKLRQKLGSAEAKALPSRSYIHGSVQTHICLRCSAGSDSITKCNPGYMSLEALCTILCDEKENNDGDLNAEDDIDIGRSSQTCPTENYGIEDDESEEKELSNHPLIYKNRMVQQSGSLPFLTMAISEAFEASCQLRSSRDTCDRCCQYIRDRVHSLATIINDICLLHDDNRTTICRVTTDNTVPVLIPSLMKAVHNLVLPYPRDQENEQIFCDIGLSALRLLTSLTHENNIAGFQLCQQYHFLNSSMSLNSYICGVDLIFILLHQLASEQKHSKSEECNPEPGLIFKARAQHTYDSIIFCLNSLTNTLETTSSLNICKSLVNLEVSNLNDNSNEKPENALSWLSNWVVDQTLPFRDAVIDATLPTSKASRGLKSSEDEYLLTAGNGFVLLACFLREDAFMPCDNPGKDITSKARRLILENIPRNDEGKLVLAINTLKAFCNFYRYSIGELSMAIIDPVLKLVKMLENADKSYIK